MRDIEDMLRREEGCTISNKAWKVGIKLIVKEQQAYVTLGLTCLRPWPRGCGHELTHNLWHGPIVYTFTWNVGPWPVTWLQSPDCRRQHLVQCLLSWPSFPSHNCLSGIYFFSNKESMLGKFFLILSLSHHRRCSCPLRHFVQVLD